MSDTASDGLAGMPTGPELGMRLALIDPHDVADEQLLEVLKAEYRQLAFQLARVWKTMAEIGGRDPMPNLPGGARWTSAEVFDNAADEIRAELVLTRRSASTELAIAHQVAALPRVMQALSDGLIDRARAIKLADGCSDLTAAQSEVLLDEVLPDAATVTATGLEERIARVAMALDPAWAQHRYTQAIRERRVVGYLNKDGSATVAGQNLPADEAAAACARVDALADAAKRAGAKAKINLLRAQLFLGLLDGRFHGMGEPAIIAELVRQFAKTAEQVEEPAEEPAAMPEPAAEPESERSESAAESQPEPTPRTSEAIEAAAESQAADGTVAVTDAEQTGWGLLTVPISRGWRLVRRDQTSFVTISPLGRQRIVGLEPVTPPLAALTWREHSDDPDPPPY